MSLASRIRNFSPYFVANKAGIPSHIVQAYGCESVPIPAHHAPLLEDATAGEGTKPDPYAYCTAAEAREIFQSVDGDHETVRRAFGLNHNTYNGVINGTASVYTLLKIKRIGSPERSEPRKRRVTDSDLTAIRADLIALVQRVDALIEAQPQE